MPSIKTIAFDADDTLWVNEPLFINTREKCEGILTPYIRTDELEQRLYETEIKNLHLFGYGIKGFVLSMIETAIQLSYGQISGQEIQQIIQLGKEMIQHPVQLLPKVTDTLLHLKDEYELMIITKGDLFDQESKIARSGLADYFDRIEIVSEKNDEMYAKIFERYQIIPKEFMMIGNSLKSDILPICQLEAHAVHIPFHTTWEHELVTDEMFDGHYYHRLPDMGHLPDLLNQINQAGH